MKSLWEFRFATPFNSLPLAAAPTSLEEAWYAGYLGSGENPATVSGLSHTALKAVHQRFAASNWLNARLAAEVVLAAGSCYCSCRHLASTGRVTIERSSQAWGSRAFESRRELVLEWDTAKVSRQTGSLSLANPPPARTLALVRRKSNVFLPFA